MDVGTVLMILVLVFGFFMAWNIGANDVANAMGTSVGSKALTFKKAVVLAAIFEFLGAYLVGGNVANTVRKKIFDPAILTELYTGYDTEPAMILACGMIAALMAAGTWLMIASYFGWPVSTTHSIVGAVVGFGCVALGASNIDWWTVIGIFAGWVVSPLLSGAVAYMVFRVILQQIFFRKDPVRAAKRIAPYLVFLVLVVLIGVVTFKGFAPFWKERGIAKFDAEPLLMMFVLSVLFGLIGMFYMRYIVKDIKSSQDEEEEEGGGELFTTAPVSRGLTKAIMHLRRVRDASMGSVNERAIALLDQVEKLHTEVRPKTHYGSDSKELQKVERIFVFLQILTACFVAFSHGSNDVANAIGPLSSAYEAIDTGKVAMKAGVQGWALALGGIGIVLGLATWGWRVIKTVGEKITELTPSRGFCAEFAAAITILAASVLPIGLPISTTHTLVGAVLGVGLARGLGALNLATMRDIVASWLITIPMGAALSIVFYFMVKTIVLTWIFGL